MNVFWRHDVDYSLDAALKMAHFEAERGVSSVYYLFQRDDNPFYSTENAEEASEELKNLHHFVGQHIDERTISVDDDLGKFRTVNRPLLSFHCPTEAVLWRNFNTFEHALTPGWKNRYSSDSNGRFKTDPIKLIETGRRVQVNLHPEWWFEPGWYHDIDDATYKAFFHVKKPHFTDSRRGRAVRSGQSAVWAFDPRPFSSHCAMWVSPEDYDAVMSRGYALIDGQRATPFVSDCDRGLGFLRLTFEAGNYVLPKGRKAAHDVRMMK